VLATVDGRISAFFFDQATKRAADYCSHRVTLAEVELRSRLVLFPMVDATKFTSLDAAIGCKGAMPETSPPSEIPAG
jgi:endonuclease G